MKPGSFLHQLRSFTASLAAAALVLTPAWADDTEIFFADTGNENIWPNVLFIIDTSGSMGETVYENGVSTGKDRLEHVQDGFRTVLNGLSNVNVGLMRFSNPGGPVLYPVFDIDADVNAVSPIEVIAKVDDDDDDAQELDTGEMLLDSDYLTLTKITTGGETFTYTVDNRYNDREQSVGSTNLDSSNSSDFDVRGAGLSNRKLHGLRFEGLDIPSGAEVTRAQIEFTVKDVDDSTAVPLTIQGEKRDSGFFYTSNGLISERTRTDAAVAWTLSGDYSNGDKVLTTDVSDIVSEIISDASWNPSGGGEDDIVFIMDPGTGSSDGDYELYTYDGASGVGSRPTLYLEYYVGTAPAEYETTTGLRFTDLDIPRGVDITSAYIEFTADRGYSGDFSFSIEAQDSGNAQSYTSSANDITDRATNGASVTWATGDAVAAGQTYRTPDISELVEDIVDRTDWCGGNDMAFMITGVEGLRSAWSYNGDPSLAPKLVVRYDYGSMPEGASCYQDNISRRIVSSYDDVEEKTNGDVSRNSNTLNLESGNLVGLRFSDINIPKGAQIMNAYLELTQKTNQDTGQDISIQIAVEDNTGDAESFSGSDDSVSSRTYAGNTVSWTNIENWYKNNAYVSPDIKDLIATAVNNNNWVAGNALVLKLNTTGSRDRRPYSFNSSPGQAPRLMVEYAATGSGGASREVRDELLTVVDNLSHSGWTPIQDTLYEAALYYTGGAVKWGAKRGGGNGESGPHAYTRVSHEASMVPNSYTINYPSGCTEENLGDYDCRTQTITGSATYASPIDNYCQKTNHIVLLTDGYANRDHSKSDIKNLIGTSSCSDSGTYSGGQNGGECVQDLTKYLSENDLSDLKLEQEVITHTIGFQFSSEWLEKVATESGGLYKSVGNADDLVGAIDNILVDALKVDNTFVAPVAAVNQFNRLNNLDDIYFAVFRPDEYPNWPGNVKKYKLGAGNIVLDKNNEPAVDASTGFFDNDSKDLWNNSAEADGKNVEKGGASSQVAGYESRNVYTYHSNSTTTTLSNNTNRLDTEQVDSGKLTKAMFDATSMTDAEFDDLIDWVRGKDVPNTTNRNAFNDPLHSRPVAVTYNVSEDDPDVEIFVGTNGGGLHSINAKTGAETFIFFPEATLPLQKDLMTNSGSQPHLYGIDGSIVPWVQDDGANGISASDGDFIRLFFGMRRGGNNYYSLDVTDRNSPKFRWLIEGGSAPFEEMGQSWGTPIRGKIKLKDDESATDVLFISGGYDEQKDDFTVQTSDSAGRAIYIVNAETGDFIWSGGPDSTFTQKFDDMQYSIPSGLTVADVDSDGLDDLIFVGDTGGQVWRFDIGKSKEVTDLISGGVIADLGVAGGANTEANNRRFFHAPDVALVKRDGSLELALSIGSGFRPSPLSSVTEDAFFMIRQRAVFGPPSVYTKLGLSDFYDATDNRVGDGKTADGTSVDTASARSDLNAKEGWYINLYNASKPGEKVLSTPLTLDDTITFITYSPNSEVVDCKAVAGVSKVYAVRIADATPAVNFDDVVEILDEGDRIFQLKTPSIVDEPVVICTGEGCEVFAGAEQPPLGDLLDNRITRTYWRKDE